MVVSGVVIDCKVKEVLQQIATTKIAGALFKFSDDNKKIIFIEDSILPLDHPAPYEEILTGFEDDNARYGVALIDMKVDANRPSPKVVLIRWCSDNAPMKQKMLSTSSFDALKKELTVSCTCVQMNSKEQKCIDEIIQKVIVVNKCDVTEFEGRKVHLNKAKKCYEYDE